jgi:hypothetical protein
VTKINETKVGLLHDPKPTDRDFPLMSAAIEYAMMEAGYDHKAVVAIWHEDVPVYIFTAGLMFKLIQD